MTRSRTAGVLAAAGLTVAALTGCAEERLGAAAVIDGRAVSTDELQEATRDYLEVVPDADAGDAQLAILQRTIVSAVIDEAARQNGVRVRPGRVAAERDALLPTVGGREGLIRTLAESQQPTMLSPADIDRWVKDRLLFEAIATELAGADLDPSSPEAQEALTRTNDELQSASRSMDIEVSPRYGRWDPDTGLTALISGGLADTPEELGERGS